MDIFTIFAILTLKWPWYDLGVILMITDSLLEYLAQFWNTKTCYRHCNTRFSSFFGFARVYFELSRSMTSRGHQRSNPVYLHILKWPLGYVLQLAEISCFYHKMQNRLLYLICYTTAAASVHGSAAAAAGSTAATPGSTAGSTVWAYISTATAAAGNTAAAYGRPAPTNESTAAAAVDPGSNTAVVAAVGNTSAANGSTAAAVESTAAACWSTAPAIYL